MADTFDAVLAEMLETADVRDLRDGAVHTELVRDWRDRLAAAHAAELAERDARIAELEGLVRVLVRSITPLHNAHMPIERELISDEDVENAQDALRRVRILAPNLLYPSSAAIATTEQADD